MRQVLPEPGDSSPERAWRNVCAALEARAFDVAVIPSGVRPVRFHARVLYEEDFIIGVRARRSFADDLSLKRYCEMSHVLVSESGEAFGFVDRALAKRGRTRRVALTVPSFMFALSVVSETDLICAFPRRFLAMHGSRFRVVAREPPIRLPTYSVTAIATNAALVDSGVEWLFALLGQQKHPSRRR
jgi:DNA-binding transcriptional LysR family regulator